MKHTTFAYELKTSLMRENPFALSHHAGDLIGVILILVIALGVSCLMWIDYRKYLDI